MLVHQTSLDYATAAAEAAHAARQKLDALIDRGRHSGLAVLQQVAAQQLHDRLVAAPDLHFALDPTDRREVVLYPGAPRETAALRLHAFALGQVADRAGLPRAYLSRLLDPAHSAWGPALLATNLNRLYRDGQAATDDDETGAYLVRAVRPTGAPYEEVRGFLSSRFKRIDSRPVLAAFADACSHVGAVPIEGYATDTKVALKAILARIYEPVPHEVMAFGMVLENSDFGHGALQVSFFMLRLWCTNYAIAEKALRRVHLGSRLTPEIAWSPATVAAETAATASLVHDLVRGRLNERHVRVLEEGIRRAHAEKVDPATVGAFLKRHLLKSEAEAVVAAFTSAETEQLPPGATKWRLSNAISWVAGTTEDAARRLELMKVAGSVVPVPELT